MSPYPMERKVMEMSHMAPRKLLVTSCWSWYLSGRRGCQCDSRGRGRDLGATGGGFPPGTPAQGGSGCSRAAGAAPGCDGSPGTRASCETGNKDEQHGRMPHSNSDCTISGKEKKKNISTCTKSEQKLNSEGFCFRSDLSPRPSPSGSVPGATWRGGRSCLMGETDVGPLL